jgi:hypothetical protein
MPTISDMWTKVPAELRLIFYVAGLYSSFIYWGFLQEKITATNYTLDTNLEKTHRWHYAFALNVFMALATFIVASIGDLLSPSEVEIPFLAFAKPAISCAMVIFVTREILN